MDPLIFQNFQTFTIDMDIYMKKTWNFSWRNSFFPIVQTLIRNRIQSGFAWSGFAWMLKVSFPRGAASSAMVDVPRGRLPAGTHSVRLCLGIGGISALVFPRARTFDVRCLGYAVHDVLLPDIVAPSPSSSRHSVSFSLFLFYLARDPLLSLFARVHSQKTGSLRRQLSKESPLPDFRFYSRNRFDAR